MCETKQQVAKLTKKLNDQSKLEKWVIPLPRIEWGKVIRVVDGDTLHLACPVEGRVLDFTVRLSGINCPEISNKKSINDAERQLGYEVKYQVQQKWLGKLLRVKSMEGYEIWGRLLATLEDEEGCCLNEWLLENRCAVPYDGKKNIKVNWPHYQKTGEIKDNN